MHPFRHIAELLHHAATALECRPPTAAPSSADTGVTNMLTQILKETRTMSDNITKLLDEQAKLKTDVAAQTTVIASATTALVGLTTQLAAAEAAAKAAGVTDDQIAGFTSVRTTLEANTAALAAAIPQNTSAASEPTSATPTADTTAEPAPSSTAPAETDPAAPTGAETPL